MNIEKCEKGSFGWFKEQAKKDGFDSIIVWNNWRRKKLPKIIEKEKKETVSNSVDVKCNDYIVIRNIVYNIDDLISGKSIKITNITKNIRSAKYVPKDICRGVYIFWVKSGEAYIGSTTLQTVKQRLIGHNCIVRKLISKINIYQTESDYQTLRLESIMINKMKPELNTVIPLIGRECFDNWEPEYLNCDVICNEEELIQEIRPEIAIIRSVIITNSDICIEKEISDLINIYSIPVLFSTCGNDKADYGFIVVKKSYEETMEKLGYKKKGTVDYNEKVYDAFEPKNLCTGLCNEEIELDDKQKMSFLNERKIVSYIVSKDGKEISTELSIDDEFKYCLEQKGYFIKSVDIFLNTKEEIERTNIFSKENV